MTVHTFLWIFSCLAIADFLPGLVHWFEDMFITLGTPIFGRVIGIPNVEHHRNPQLLAKKGTFLRRNAASAILGIIWVFISWLLGILNWQMTLIAIIAALGNEVHEWNHSIKPKNRLVAFIQDTGLVQSKRPHALHHRRPYTAYYCTITNFTNAVLERLNFWRGLEWVFVNILGLKVRRLSVEREGF